MLSRTPEDMRLEVKPRKILHLVLSRTSDSLSLSRSSSLIGSSLSRQASCQGQTRTPVMHGIMTAVMDGKRGFPLPAYEELVFLIEVHTREEYYLLIGAHVESC